MPVSGIGAFVGFMVLAFFAYRLQNVSEAKRWYF